jgi:hypothetical protein
MPHVGPGKPTRQMSEGDPFQIIGGIPIAINS